MDEKIGAVEAAVIQAIATNPQPAAAVRERLVQQGFSGGEVRTAVANLWDAGRLNVGIDQVLRPTDG